MQFNHKVKIIVPSTKDTDTEIDNSKYVREVAEKLTAMFGGATARTPRVFDAEGFWVSDTAGLIVEAVKEVESLSESLTDEQIEAVIQIALDLKEEMTQESVMYEIDGISYLTD